MSKRTELLQEQLFREGANTFAILDGASVPGLLAKLEEWRPEFECLYRGELKPDLAEVAPYLIRLNKGAEITEWILSDGWAKHWGIFAIAEADLPSLRQHLRRLLTVHDESGKPLLFRFYDPRVLRVYLPTCNSGELNSIFGQIEYYVSEVDDPGKLAKFQLESQILATQMVALT